MNKPYVIYNLEEAKKQLDHILKDVENDGSYDFGAYKVDMQHLYHHLNTAWNARQSSQEESRECAEKDFEKWRQFPGDIYMGI